MIKILHINQTVVMKPTVCIMYTNMVHRTESLILQTNLVVTLSYFLARDTEVNSFR